MQTLEMNQRMRRLGVIFCLAGLLHTCAWSEDDPAREWPDFEKVLGLVRTELPGISEAELNSAAIEGLLARFRPRVELMAAGSRQPRSLPDHGSVGLRFMNRRSAISG